jgi:hypothetical protein
LSPEDPRQSAVIACDHIVQVFHLSTLDFRWAFSCRFEVGEGGGVHNFPEKYSWATTEHTRTWIITFSDQIATARSLQRIGTTGNEFP